MTRKCQYLGLTVLICALVIYISTPFNSSVQTSSHKFSKDNSDHSVGANTTEKAIETTSFTSDENISQSESDRFGDGKDRVRISKGSHVEATRQRESEHLALTGRLKAPSEEHIDGDTHVEIHKGAHVDIDLGTHINSSKLTTKKTLQNFQGDKILLTEKRHIAFLKVHKAASTTLQTMFFRFGFERNLSFVLPVKGNYFSLSAKTHEDIVQPLHGDHYDIICNHGVFSYKIYSEIMPNDTVYLAVVRKPFDQFVSAVNYYTDLYQFKYLMDVPGDRIKNLIKHPEKYDTPLSYTMNSMARDFGFKDHHYFSDSSMLAKRYLEKLDGVFDFVLIAEYFDESLILMKRLLRWSLKDILYISKNVRGSTVEIGESLMKTFRARNKLDYLVYDFFYEKFKQTLKKSKESILVETEHFRRILITVQHWCMDSFFGELTIDASKWNEKFVLNTKDCQLMTKKELNFIRLLKNEPAS